MRIFPVVDIANARVGRHALWFPSEQVKFPFQWGGRITKYAHAEAAYPVRETLPHELAILRALAAEGMAPPVRDIVYAETIISDHPGAWHADPCGAWGYEVADVERLPLGRFDIDRMRALPIAGSEGAWGDVKKPGNVVNGYLVDVRRTAWDMLQWTGGDLPEILDPPVDSASLLTRVHRDCQFPRGERDVAYQDFWLDGRLHRGQRRVAERAAAMGFAPAPGESVLDVGCQSGGFLQYAHATTRGDGRFVGVDVEADYVDCARALARSSAQNICFRRMDVCRETEAFLAWVLTYFPHGVDHLLLLSLEKHLGDDFLFELADTIGARRTYIETNAVAKDSGEGPEPSGEMKLWERVSARGGKHVGNSRDRNLRRLYRIER